MNMINDESAISLIRLASDYTTQSQSLSKDEREKACEIAVKNASLFGKILQQVQVYLTSRDVFPVTSLTDNLIAFKLPRNSIEQCVSVLDHIKKNHPCSSSVCHSHMPFLKDVRWRVDITISSSVLSRVLEPNLIMEWQLSNGQKVMFEVSVAKFHKLRFIVASILKEMNKITMKLNSIKS